MLYITTLNAVHSTYIVKLIGESVIAQVQGLFRVYDLRLSVQTVCHIAFMWGVK